MRPEFNIPTFAVVGRVNKGKSSILATLVEEDDNTRIRISATPGETTQCQRIPLVINGDTLIQFIDTPGFSNAPEALEWMTAHHDEQGKAARIDTVRRFVKEHRRDERFRDECLLLDPITGSDDTRIGIIYVVDASKPFRNDFLAEMEILRWTGRPRMAILNNISGEAGFSAEWKTHLGEYFNLTREFNAHRARFTERIRLLRQLLEIEDNGKTAIEKTIGLLEIEWDQRRSESADVIVDLVQDCLRMRTSRTIAGKKIARDYQREKIAVELKEQYVVELTELESAYHQKLLKTYRHTHTALAATEPPVIQGSDLFAKEVWQFLGLDMWQLAVTGGIAGAAAGGAIDVMAGGHFLGLPTAVGGLAGFAAPLLTGKALARIQIDIPFVPSEKASMGGVRITAGPPRNPNFAWILLDRVLVHYHDVLVRAHGRRDAFLVNRGAGGGRSGYTARFSGSRRRLFQGWFNRLLKDKASGETEKIFNELRAILEEIESGTL